MYELEQRSPTFLAPGTSFVEDNFSTDWGVGGMVQVVMPAMGSNGEPWGVMGSHGERWGAMGSGRRSFARWPAAHLRLHGLVPNRPQTNTSPQPGDWGHLN